MRSKVSDLGVERLLIGPNCAAATVKTLEGGDVLEVIVRIEFLLLVQVLIL